MAGVRFFRKIVPIALAGAAALVMVIPMSASAGDVNHHDQIPPGVAGSTRELVWRLASFSYGCAG
jgi:hypothetical protein